MTARPAPAHRAPGFTLIELLVVVSLVAILAALAAPGMRSLVASQRVRTTASDLHLALVKTRSEALKRNAPVTLRPANAGDWASGWQIVATVDGTLRVVDVTPVRGSVQVQSTPAIASVVFGYDGRTSAAAGGVQFSVSDAGTSQARCVSIDPAGRPYTREGATC
ncbi:MULTISPECIES: GspH/FimT family pseudopilin [unclassified Ramlibacter]|uniref:GspH/FimT family pseudopilin n=1 Tax=unclassified Ramlibacter TaxID=2617605 RepID=UPI00362B2B3A